jgi:hypothetical protein
LRERRRRRSPTPITRSAAAPTAATAFDRSRDRAANAQPPELPLSPFEGATHCPLVSQTFGDAQSLIDPHIVWQLPPAHANGAQSFLWPAGSTTV